MACVSSFFLIFETDPYSDRASVFKGGMMLARSAGGGLGSASARVAETDDRWEFARGRRQTDGRIEVQSVSQRAAEGTANERFITVEGPEVTKRRIKADIGEGGTGGGILSKSRCQSHLTLQCDRSHMFLFCS